MFGDCVYLYIYLEPQTTIYKWMFGETTISCVKIGNHPTETAIYRLLDMGFQVYISHHQVSLGEMK